MADEFEFTADSSAQRLDTYVANHTGRSRMFIKHQIESGNVRVNGTTAKKPSMKLKKGDQIELALQERKVELEPRPGELDILCEDKYLLVLNKPQGLVVHPAATSCEDTLVHYLLHHLQSNELFQVTSNLRPGIVHRLDKGTSGVILIAKDSKTLENLARQFRKREVSKEYEAIVWGKIRNEGTFESMIGRHFHHRQKMSSKTHRGREAVTAFKRLKFDKHFSHVQLFPHTGRTHQLRVHLSEAGHPIVSDTVYEPRSVAGKKGQLQDPIGLLVRNSKYPFLHARRLTFRHPTNGKQLTFEAPYPKPFTDLVSLIEETKG